MQSNRCRHYQLETELIAVPGAPVMLRIPVRRCHLAEHMLERLAATERGAEIAPKLMFPTSLLLAHSANDPDVPRADGRLIRAVFGPDLEPIHHDDCIAERCLASCTPGYIFLMEQFGTGMDVRHAEGKGCQEATETSELREDAR